MANRIDNWAIRGESGRIILDVVKVCDLEKLSSYLVATDFETHNFLNAFLKEYGFGESFLDWMKILLAH